MLELAQRITRLLLSRSHSDARRGEGDTSIPDAATCSLAETCLRTQGFRPNYVRGASILNDMYEAIPEAVAKASIAFRHSSKIANKITTEMERNLVILCDVFLSLNQNTTAASGSIARIPKDQRQLIIQRGVKSVIAALHDAAMRQNATSDERALDPLLRWYHNSRSAQKLMQDFLGVVIDPKQHVIVALSDGDSLPPRDQSILDWIVILKAERSAPTPEALVDFMARLPQTS